MHDNMAKPADRYRLRFRELLHAAGVSQAVLCERLTKRTKEPWRESRLSKMLNGHIAFTIDDLVIMADESGVSLLELFREPGREFVADLTPSELNVIHTMRESEDFRAITDRIRTTFAKEARRKLPRQIIRERIRLGRQDE